MADRPRPGMNGDITIHTQPFMEDGITGSGDAVQRWRGEITVDGVVVAKAVAWTEADVIDLCLENFVREVRSRAKRVRRA